MTGRFSKFIPVLLLLPSLGWSASFSSSARGTATAGFLKLGVGARAVSMGEAYSALADEASALYWNPAALTQVPSRSATFMHAVYIESSFFDYGAYAQNMGAKGSWGVGIQYLSAGSITETDDTGTEVGSFSPNDLAFSAGYAYELKDLDSLAVLNGFSFGIGAKFIRSKIIDSARTGAVDLGILSPGYINDKLKLALTVSNLGGRMKFEQESEDLPLALRLGSAWKIRNRWIAGLDVGFPRDNAPYAALGTEYILPVMDAWELAGRLGFNSRTTGDIDGLTGISFGLGFAVQKVAIDYGFLPFGSVGLTHRISLTLKN